jgi:hypothetical protein
VSPADLRSELGPRSLDPDRSFWSAFAELIRDQTSPTDFCNCTYDVRATKPGLFDPRRDGDLDLLPFLTCHAASLARAVTRGEPRSVRPFEPRCRFLLLAQVCPTAMSTRTPHLRACARSIVRIDVHGSPDRVKDASPGACDDESCSASGACAWFAHADGVPLLGNRWTSAVTGAPISPGRYPRRPTDRPRPSFRQRPAKSATFPKTGMPFTATTREGFAQRPKGLLPPAFAPALSLTPPTLCPLCEDRVF